MRNHYWFLTGWDYNPSVLVPAAWGDLPLSTRHWDSLNYCAVDLPMFLASHQTDIDDEIVSFTQNGGWQKINNLLPPLIRSDHVHRYFLDTNLVWVDAVQILFHNLKVSLSVLHRDGL